MPASRGKRLPSHPLVCVISCGSPLASCPGAPASDRLSPCQYQDGDFTAGNFNQRQRTGSPLVTPLPLSTLLLLSSTLPLAFSVFALPRSLSLSVKWENLKIR